MCSPDESGIESIGNHRSQSIQSQSCRFGRKWFFKNGVSIHQSKGCPAYHQFTAKNVKFRIYFHFFAIDLIDFLLLTFFDDRLSRFEKTNEVLTNCNALASSRFEFVCKDFRTYRQQLSEMKKDLDYIHKTLRLIKGKLATKYPTEFGKAKNERKVDHDLDEEDEEEKEERGAVEEQTTKEKRRETNVGLESSETPKTEEAVEVIQEAIEVSGQEVREDEEQMPEEAKPPTIVQEALEIESQPNKKKE